VEFCLCVSLERLATFVLSIPEGVVERRTAVHPVRAFTSIGRDCVGCYVVTWKGDCLGSSSRGQPRGALPLHQVTQRQFIKFADPTRRSGHNKLLHVLPRREHINPKVDAKLAELVQVTHKFAKQSRVRIFRNERTRSTPLDPQLMFWAISDRFVTTRMSMQN
jgi:hypothetical protein